MPAPPGPLIHTGATLLDPAIALRAMAAPDSTPSAVFLPSHDNDKSKRKVYPQSVEPKQNPNFDSNFDLEIEGP
jgi:hypothetical protein